MIDTLLSNQWLVSNILATVMVIVALSVAIGVVKWFMREFGSSESSGTLLGLLLKVSCFTVVAWCAIYMTKSFHSW